MPKNAITLTIELPNFGAVSVVFEAMRKAKELSDASLKTGRKARKAIIDDPAKLEEHMMALQNIGLFLPDDFDQTVVSVVD